MGTDQEKVEKPVDKIAGEMNDPIRQEYTFASDVVLKECKYCRVMIPKKAKVCPNCKMILKNYTFLKVAAAILVLAVIVAGVAVGVKAVEPTEAANATETVNQEEVKTAVSNMEEKKEEPKPSVESVSVKEDASNDKAATEDKVVTEDKAAVEDKSSVEDQSDAEEKETTEEKDDIEDQSDTEEQGVKEDQTDAEKKDVKEDLENEEDDEPMAAMRDIDESEAAFRAECVQRKYKSLLRDEEYLETAVLVAEAEVICQVDGCLIDENIYYLCMEEENYNECYYIIRDDRSADETLILEGDIITVYGRLFGTCKIPAGLIETRPTVPAISMESFDLLGE